MSPIWLLLKVLKKDFLPSFNGFFLFLGLVLFLDFLCALLLAPFIGTYVTLGYLCFSLALGYPLLYTKLRRLHDHILAQRRLAFPQNAFWELASLSVFGIFFVLPGLISLCLAVIATTPSVSVPLGRWLTQRMRIDWQEIYEHIAIDLL